MLAHEWQQLLLGCLALQKRADCPEAILAVTVRNFAGVIDCRGEMPTGKAQKADQHSHSLDSAGPNHRLCPSGALGSQPGGYLAQEPRRAFLDPADLIGVNEFRRCAETTWFHPEMHGDLLHPIVVDRHQAAVPARPDFPVPVFRRHRIVGPLDLNMAIAVDSAAALVE